VDYADRPIVVTRPHGRPRLAAPALGGVAWASADPIPPPLTGTSVSAAVASGVAAVAWSRNPSLSGLAVMNALHQSGVGVMANADTCPAGTPSLCDVRRISLCSALGAVGVLGLACAPPPALGSSTPPLDPTVMAETTSTFAAASTATATTAPLSDFSSLPRYLVPSAALSGGVFPEPIEPVCPNCIYSIATTTCTLYARSTTTITSPTLVLVSGSTSTTRSTGLSTLTAGTSYTVTVSGTTSVTAAYLTGTSDAGTSVTQQLAVAR